MHGVALARERRLVRWCLHLHIQLGSLLPWLSQLLGSRYIWHRIAILNDLGPSFNNNLFRQGLIRLEIQGYGAWWIQKSFISCGWVPWKAAFITRTQSFRIFQGSSIVSSCLTPNARMLARSISWNHVVRHNRIGSELLFKLGFGISFLLLASFILLALGSTEPSKLWAVWLVSCLGLAQWLWSLTLIG